MPERLTWKEIEQRYPNSWIVMDNVKMDHGDIAEADVIAVLTDDEVDKYMVDNWEKHYTYDRTNPEELGGLIQVEGINFTLK